MNLKVFEVCERTHGRDVSLDFCRGCAVLSVVWIHTVYHSGESYSPAVLKTMALLVDVPLFMFLAGCSARFSKGWATALRGVLHTLGLWSLFCAALCLACAAFGDSTASFESWLKLSLGQGPSPSSVPSVGYSAWFLPMYARVATIGGFIIALTKDMVDCREARKCFCTLLIVWLATLSWGSGDSGVIPVRQTCMYLALYLLGYETYGMRLRSFAALVGSMAIMVAIWKCLALGYGIPARGLQSTKFPPHIMYFAASIPSILVALYLRGNRVLHLVTRFGFVCYLGRNALMFYFAQGIGASLLYRVAPIIPNEVLPLKLVACYLINVLVSVGVGHLFILLRGHTHVIADSHFLDTRSQ